jgi:hypothetical protein
MHKSFNGQPQASGEPKEVWRLRLAVKRILPTYFYPCLACFNGRGASNVAGWGRISLRPSGDVFAELDQYYVATQI